MFAATVLPLALSALSSRQASSAAFRIRRGVVQQTGAHLGELDEQSRVTAQALACQLVGRHHRPSGFALDTSADLRRRVDRLVC
jgi:hypothetical protein